MVPFSSILVKYPILSPKNYPTQIKGEVLNKFVIFFKKVNSIVFILIVFCRYVFVVFAFITIACSGGHVLARRLLSQVKFVRKACA